MSVGEMGGDKIFNGSDQFVRSYLRKMMQYLVDKPGCNMTGMVVQIILNGLVIYPFDIDVIRFVKGVIVFHDMP